ncbi:hypothetical protein JOB18_004724 [Solea senegalensis]|uniref:Lebercilin-like protein n=1 Tax=Solea senegalensis TaxID=28829 RepID=A0AAV6RFF4_SOLSE|nr:hypothetical protein JOB18_004724 [Solea senegalensis]
MSVSRKTTDALPQTEGDGDYAKHNTTNSRSCTSSKPCCGSHRQHDSCYEDSIDSLKGKTSQSKSSDRGQRSKQGRAKTGKKSLDNHQTPYKPMQTRLENDILMNTKALKSQVWDLQRQLSEAHNENKLLKRVQHRYMVALKHFEDSEDNITETITKHRNEVRALRAHLHDTRRCRNHLLKKLRATEYELQTTKNSLQHLQKLSQDQSLLEKEELVRMLDKATAELEEKDKRILYLERDFQLCKDSFNRQLASMKRKLSQAKSFSTDLQEQICLLTKENEEHTKKLQAHNIYSNRFVKGAPKIDKENKVVQTHGLILLPVYHSEIKVSSYKEESFETKHQETASNVMSEESYLEVTDVNIDNFSSESEEELFELFEEPVRSDFEILEEPVKSESVIFKEPAKSKSDIFEEPVKSESEILEEPLMLPEMQKIEERESNETSLNTTRSNRREHMQPQNPQIKKSLTFQTPQSLLKLTCSRPERHGSS